MLFGTHSRWHVRLHPGEDAETVTQQAEGIMEALLDIETKEGLINSAAVSVDLGAMLVEIDLAADADSLDEAQQLVDDAVRRAVVMAGGNVLSGQAQMVERSAELIPA
jgi:hypothetical protein